MWPSLEDSLVTYYNQAKLTCKVASMHNTQKALVLNLWHRALPSCGKLAQLYGLLWCCVFGIFVLKQLPSNHTFKLHHLRRAPKYQIYGKTQMESQHRKQNLWKRWLACGTLINQVNAIFFMYLLLRVSQFIALPSSPPSLCCVTDIQEAWMNYSCAEIRQWLAKLRVFYLILPD